MTKIFNPLGRTMQRRDFLKVAGASVAVAALPAAVRGADPVKIVLWSWVPDLQLQVDMFNAAHPGIQIELVNAGQGDPEYQAVRAGLQAGSGLPDVVQIEFQHLESFRQLDAFADIGEWANPHKAEFPEGTWSQLGQGGVINAMPQDTGPMAMLYRKDIFDKQGITPPTTWDEFADAADKIHAADSNVFITDALFSSGDWVNALLWPMGWKPVSRDGDKLVININDQISKDFAAYWQELITAGVIETKPGFNNEWYTGLELGPLCHLAHCGLGSGVPDLVRQDQRGPVACRRSAAVGREQVRDRQLGWLIAGRDESDPASARGRRSRDLAVQGSRSHKALHHQAILLPHHQRAAVEPGMGGQQDGFLRRPGGERSVRQIVECRGAV